MQSSGRRNSEVWSDENGPDRYGCCLGTPRSRKVEQHVPAAARVASQAGSPTCRALMAMDDQMCVASKPAEDNVWMGWEWKARHWLTGLQYYALARIRLLAQQPCASSLQRPSSGSSGTRTTMAAQRLACNQRGCEFQLVPVLDSFSSALMTGSEGAVVAVLTTAESMVLC
jgi:hypothetical protein